MSTLEFRDLRVERNGRELLRSVALRIHSGEMLALVGANGAGKTTLLRCALGLVKQSRGEVCVDGRDVRDLTARERAAALAWLPQHVDVVEGFSAEEVVAAARFRFGEGLGASRRASLEALRAVEAEELANAPHSRLSGGERQRVAIACLLAQETPFVLLDEPANHLDPRQQVEVYRWISRLRASGIGVLCVTHDVNLLGVVDGEVRIAGLAGGSVAFECEARDASLVRHLETIYGTPLCELKDASGRRVIQAADATLAAERGP